MKDDNRGYYCRVERDSISNQGKRLTTFVVCFPRFILAEFNTHRALSKNAASSRAIPVKKRIADIKEAPFIPAVVYYNEPGMQGNVQLSEDDYAKFVANWLNARDKALDAAQALMELNIHKQTANRLLEPFAWITDVVTATEWTNFFALRYHKDAQPEFQHIAQMMYDAYVASIPTQLQYDEWHLPFTDAETWVEAYGHVLQGETRITRTTYTRQLEAVKQASVARCARVSTLQHDGTRSIQKDLELYSKLLNANPGHMSPFEHVAAPSATSDFRSGNFRGYHQFRKEITNENITTLPEGFGK